MLKYKFRPNIPCSNTAPMYSEKPMCMKTAATIDRMASQSRHGRL